LNFLKINPFNQHSHLINRLFMNLLTKKKTTFFMFNVNIKLIWYLEIFIKITHRYDN
jgi:hypothetical protein